MLNFDEVLCNSRMNFLLTTNWLSVTPAHVQRVYLFLSVIMSIRKG